jgi:hypothetical protein
LQADGWRADPVSALHNDNAEFSLTASRTHKVAKRFRSNLKQFGQKKVAVAERDSQPFNFL